MIATALLLGMLIGLALGLLGGGGSILTVPVFVYVLGAPPKDAIAMSLAVVGATSAFGMFAHWRAGHVNLRIGLVFALVATAGTYAGTRLASHVSGTTQLAIFAGVMLAAAASMLRRRPESPGPRPAVQRGGPAMVAGAGLLVGLLTGLVGVGGGFLIVPALIVIGISMTDAVGTSLLVIAANCVVGFYGYLGHVTLTWSSILPVIAGTLPAIWIGSSLHRLVPQQLLRRSFAALLVVVSAVIFYENLGAMFTNR